MDWVDALARLRDRDEPCVLVTVTSVRGHAPRDPGAKMVVSATGLWGSVGGGNLEATAVQRARAMLADGVTVLETAGFGLSEHVPTEHGRQCCGGEVQLLLEPVPVRATVAVFGLGHVGYELARILSRLELRLVLVDTRAGRLTEEQRADLDSGPATVTVLRPVAPETVLADLPAGAHLLVLTHDHAEDLAILDAALRRPGWGSVGLIGSAAKWARFRRRLLHEGHPARLVDAIRCPIGVPGVAGKEPAVIAVSVAAELLDAAGPLARHRPAPEAPPRAAGS